MLMSVFNFLSSFPVKVCLAMSFSRSQNLGDMPGSLLVIKGGGQRGAYRIAEESHGLESHHNVHVTRTSDEVPIVWAHKIIDNSAVNSRLERADPGASTTAPPRRLPSNRMQSSQASSSCLKSSFLHSATLHLMLRFSSSATRFIVCRT